MKHFIITTFTILGFIICLNGQVPTYVPINGLVGWWPFKGNANDDSGNGNNGNVNGATLTTDRFGNANNAYSFDGINDDISANRIALSTFTFSGWYYLNQNQLYSPVIDAYNVNWEILIYSLKPAFVKWVSAPSNYQVLPSTFNSLTNHWYHLACTYSSNQVNIYLDGSLIKTFSNIPLTNINNGVFYFGRSTSGTSQYLDGKLDDIGIWNRVLTPTEISILYENCILNVIQQPISQSALITNNVQFSTSSSHPLTNFQWQSDIGFGFQNLINSGQYSGVNDDTLKVSNLTMSNNNELFRCIITAGSCIDTSNIAILTVLNNNSINNNSIEDNISINPNPITRTAFLNVYTLPNTLLRVKLYDINGNLVKVINAETISNGFFQKTLNFEDLNNGIYFLLINENEKVSYKKIVVMN